MSPKPVDIAGIARKTYATEAEMGKAAAEEVGALLRDLTVRDGVPVLLNLAAAPSQDAFLDALSAEEGIDWTKVTAIHLDEYFDLPADHPNTFRSYLQEHIISRVPIPAGQVHFIKDVPADTPAALAEEYGRRALRILKDVRAAGGVYLACIGIGVNGHIAFNEPGSAIRTDRFLVPIEIDAVSVQQQYDDYKNHPDPAARYATLDDVPRRAITVSCAGILAADRIVCLVPGPQKAAAVRGMWDGPVSDDMPASLLRLHPCVTVYLEVDSAARLDHRPTPA
ncbi:MAG: glucosamine-6-phosphate deaminase [Candidatus Brocadiaceae bacterium]|nr:glucosamine-6-phosphate deaminase [Candidatus Brocadiaceae bacterium]